MGEDAHLLYMLRGRGALHWGLRERHAPVATWWARPLQTLQALKPLSPSERMELLLVCLTHLSLTAATKDNRCSQATKEMARHVSMHCKEVEQKYRCRARTVGWMPRRAAAMRKGFCWSTLRPRQLWSLQVILTLVSRSTVFYKHAVPLQSITSMLCACKPYHSHARMPGTVCAAYERFGRMPDCRMWV